MRLKDLRTHRDVVFDDIVNDPEYARELARTFVARAVADRLVGYRADKKWSQARLAKMLGMTQSAVARLESGDHNPGIETLRRISGSLGIEFLLDIRPARGRRQWIGKQAKAAPVVRKVNGEGSQLFIAVE